MILKWKILQSADARRAFPCWDEPVYKAKFDVTLVVDKDLTALSNMVSLTLSPFQIAVKSAYI